MAKKKWHERGLKREREREINSKRERVSCPDSSESLLSLWKEMGGVWRRTQQYRGRTYPTPSPHPVFLINNNRSRMGWLPTWRVWQAGSTANHMKEPSYRNWDKLDWHLWCQALIAVVFLHSTSQTSPVNPAAWPVLWHLLTWIFCLCCQKSKVKMQTSVCQRIFPSSTPGTGNTKYEDFLNWV